MAAVASADRPGFLKYVFAFDDEVKCQVGNMLQYAGLALLPVLGILKSVQHLVPEEDPSKSSVYLAAESMGQIALVLVMMWLTDRAIRYIPTMSGCVYGDFQPVAFLLPFLVILATLQTKLGAKLSLIMERIIGDEEPVHRPDRHRDHRQAQESVRVTQPLANVQQRPPPPVHQPSQADQMGVPKLVPDDRQLTAMPTQVQPQQSPDFNKMYQGPTTPLQNAATPGGGDPRGSAAQATALQEPMAANEVLGGGGTLGSSW